MRFHMADLPTSGDGSDAARPRTREKQRYSHSEGAVEGSEDSNFESRLITEVYVAGLLDGPD